MPELSPQTLQEIWAWHQAQKNLEAAKAFESEARSKLVVALAESGALDSDILEGTINVQLPEKWKLKVVRKLNRTVDVAALSTIGPLCIKNKISLDVVIRNKPELSVTEFKKLTEEQRKVVEMALTIKPGTPTLELIAPPTKE